MVNLFIYLFIQIAIMVNVQAWEFNKLNEGLEKKLTEFTKKIVELERKNSAFESQSGRTWG